MNLNAASIERLLLKTGEQPTPDQINTLTALIVRQGLLRTSPRVRRRMLPWGVHEHFTGSGGGGGVVSPYFLPKVGSLGQGEFAVRWERGLIGGVEPTIDGVPISGHPKTGIQPKFVVPPVAFDTNGEARVYFRLSLAPDFSVRKVEPFASRLVPPLEPFAAYRLSFLLFEDGSFWRKLIANQGYRAINRQSSGHATHIFWPKF